MKRKYKDYVVEITTTCKDYHVEITRFDKPYGANLTPIVEIATQNGLQRVLATTEFFPTGEQAQQQTVLKLFAFALNPGKYLFLGKSDTAIRQREMLQSISRNWRIFQCKQLMASPFGASQ